jgi:hypothetical protein
MRCRTFASGASTTDIVFELHDWPLGVQCALDCGAITQRDSNGRHTPQYANSRLDPAFSGPYVNLLAATREVFDSNNTVSKHEARACNHNTH